jgi:hypothetical protein
MLQGAKQQDDTVEHAAGCEMRPALQKMRVQACHLININGDLLQGLL